MPGIIEGAASGKGRGKEVIAVARSADLIMMVLDGAKEMNNQHRNILERELETMHIRLNKRPPDIYFRKKVGGGVKFNSVVPLTKVSFPKLSSLQKLLQCLQSLRHNHHLDYNRLVSLITTYYHVLN